ncbi:hypothetical protein SUGI_0907730 [Cryptomeria japonica]|nr:hypothetical protein SUGI_0907730 [Cryptomeria japonica]
MPLIEFESQQVDLLDRTLVPSQQVYMVTSPRRRLAEESGLWHFQLLRNKPLALEIIPTHHEGDRGRASALEFVPTCHRGDREKKTSGGIDGRMFEGVQRTEER